MYMRVCKLVCVFFFVSGGLYVRAVMYVCMRVIGAWLVMCVHVCIRRQPVTVYACTLMLGWSKESSLHGTWGASYCMHVCMYVLYCGDHACTLMLGWSKENSLHGTWGASYCMHVCMHVH